MSDDRQQWAVDDPESQMLMMRISLQQLSLAALEELTDEQLVFVSGHREWVELVSEHRGPGPDTSKAQDDARRQERIIRSNAIRAKDVLDWRIEKRQIKALELSNATVAESNRHVASTAEATADLAKSTKWMAAATIVVAIIAAITLVASIVAS